MPLLHQAISYETLNPKVCTTYQIDSVNNIMSLTPNPKSLILDKVMAFDASGSETHFYQKSYYSREGSVGGFGTTGGGGCGCY